MRAGLAQREPGRVAQARSLHEQVKLTLAEAELAVDVEVRRAHSQWQQATELAEASARVVEQATEAVRLANARYNAGTGTLTLSGVSVERNGNEVGEDGVQLVNSGGTVTVNGANTFRDNASNQFEAQNGSGTATFNISGSFVAETFALVCPQMPKTASQVAMHYTSVTISGEPKQLTQFVATMISVAMSARQP